MKKSLSLLLAIALVISMFGSMAYAADNDMTAQQKFDALKEKGIFAGYEDGSAGLDKNMTRAQFARVAALLLGLDADTAPAKADFTDVATTHWAAGAIHSVDVAGVMNGKGNGIFDPKGDVTIEQLARVLVDALGLKVDESATVEGKTAAWATKYVAAAIANGLVPASSDYTIPAIREVLVESAFVVAELKAEPAAQAVVSLTATGAKKLTVSFAKAVEDASKIKFTIKKGAASVAVASENAYTWSTDKKSVVITLDSKMTEGTYSVAVAPAADDNGVTINDGTKEVKVTNEKILSVEILSASEYIAKYANNIITFVAKNQYDEQSDLSASRFSLISGNSTDAPATAVADKQQVKLKTDTLPKDTRIALTIVAPDATAQATKVFIVGDVPSVSKIEVGDLKLEDGKERLTAGETAVLGLTVYDQYGNKMTDATEIKKTVTLISTRGDVIANDGTGLEINGDANLAITTKSGITSNTDVLLTLIANGSGASVNHSITVYAPKSPTDLSFGDFSDTVAAGDGTIYLPLVVLDQFGEKMSAKDVAGVKAQFNVYSTNSSILTGASIHDTADGNQGKVAVVVSPTATGNATITVMINSNGKSASFPISVQEKRVPNTIVVDSEPAPKALPGAVSKIKFKIKDQYGKNISANNADYRVDFAVDDSKSAFTTPTGSRANVFTQVSDGVEFELKADKGNIGVMKFTAKLVKVSDSSTISSVSRTVEAVKADVANDLTYEVAQIGKLYDSSALNPGSVTKMSKEISVKAKDGSGNAVALPASVITAVYSSDTGVAQVVGSNNIKGVGKGSATLTVEFQPATGNIKIATQVVEVSDVKPFAESLTVSNATKANTRANLNKVVWDGEVAGDIKLVDQYGIEYKNIDLVSGADFASSINVKFGVTNVKGGTASINAATGVLTVGAGVESFTIQVYSLTNGKTAEVKVTVY